ncbi:MULTISPECIES: hypothetical protein [unclassified Streptomyces]|uniref:DUF7144 family membrane protein n=1 Tax=unclassified Streptomyces TaxID=2593676 RepID=UPI0037F89542
MASRNHLSGWTVLAGVLMIIGGVMAILEGIAALAHDHVFLVTRDYFFRYSLTGWGWIHLILGVVILLAGCALFSGAVWARMVGVTLAAIAALANFLWIPNAPFWAIVMLAMNITIIWALCTADRRRVT